MCRLLFSGSDGPVEAVRALSAMQVVLVLAEHPWLVVLILVVLVLRLRFVRATAYMGAPSTRRAQGQVP
jgi:hypothetical protein